MTFVECPREQDVIDAVTTRQWPERCGAELTSHVAGCEGCRTIVETMAAIGEAWHETRANAHLPASGMVWWRAQMRARREAARAAARPLTVVQAVGGVAGLALMVAMLMWIAPWLSASFATSMSMMSLTLPDFREAVSSWAIAGAIAVLALTSLAVYLAVAED